jgi:hypothetical protein
LRLASAIAADQQPALRRLNPPVHATQDRAFATVEIDTPERDGE